MNDEKIGCVQHDCQECKDRERQSVPAGFKQRCTVAVECLPNAPYRTMLANLLDEMLAAIAKDRERQSVPSGWYVTNATKSTVKHWPITEDQAIALAAAPQPQPVQEPVATVIKKGSERQWMSERLGRFPDGIYSLYTSPQAQPARPLPVQPTANSGDAEKAVLDRMAKYVSTITQSEIDEADGDRGITSPQAQGEKQ